MENENELLTLQDERQVFQECFDTLEAIFAPNCRELVSVTFLRLVLKQNKEAVRFPKKPPSWKRHIKKNATSRKVLRDGSSDNSKIKGKQKAI